MIYGFDAQICAKTPWTDFRPDCWMKAICLNGVLQLLALLILCSEYLALIRVVNLVNVCYLTGIRVDSIVIFYCCLGLSLITFVATFFLIYVHPLFFLSFLGTNSNNIICCVSAGECAVIILNCRLACKVCVSSSILIDEYLIYVLHLIQLNLVLWQ